MPTQTINLGNGNNTDTYDSQDYIVTAGNGNNTLTFGSGNDTLTLGGGSNTLTLGGGTDDITLGGGNNTVTTSGTGADSITATGGNSTFTVGDGANVITAGDGLNTATAGNGDNTITLGNGFDQVTAGDGNNAITVGNGPGDVVYVGTGSNTIAIGTGSADIVHTGGDRNTVFVTAAALGADTVYGALTTGDGAHNTLQVTTAGNVNPDGVSGFGIIQLANGAANTMTLQDANFARLSGGVITVQGGNSGNTVNAASLSAAHGVDIFDGAGTDSLTGGAANDTFNSAPGQASVDGGAGINTMVYTGARSDYTVTAQAGGVFHVVGANTNDTLTRIQQVTFSDQSVPVTVFLTPTLALSPQSDSGIKGDDITNVAQPTLTGTAEGGSIVNLTDGGALIGSTVADPTTGLWSIAATTPLAQGPNALVATATYLTDASYQSVPLNVTLDTVAPAAPSGLTLPPQTDSGTKGDDLTNIAKPVITGTAEAGSTVSLYDANTLIGTGTTDPTTGAWSVAATGALSEGTNAITATATDAAGNVSAPSAALSVTLDTTPPAAPAALTLAPVSDSGVKGDDITNVVTPVITGTGAIGDTVTLFDANTAIGTAVVANDGKFSVTASGILSTGTHNLTATQSDQASNVSASSASLALTIVPTVHNIYDSAGTLIGTVSGPGAQSGFSTTALSGGAAAITDPSSGVVTLLSESNAITTQGNDTVDAGSGNTTVFAAGATTSVNGGSGSLLLVEGTGNATLTGGTGAATVFGGVGTGLFTGGSAGGNVLVAGAGNTTLIGGGVGDVLVSGAGNTTISMQRSSTGFGGAGASTITGADGSILVGGSGPTTLVAGSGAEGLYGGTGTSVLYGGTGLDTMAGSAAGQTNMIGGSGNTLYIGSTGAATIFGGNGNDTIFGGAGSLKVLEGSGSDQILFGTEAASVTGGTGTDLYSFINGKAGGSAVVSGFKVGTDRINLYNYDLSTVGTATVGGNTTVSLSDGTKLTLLGVTNLGNTSIV